MIAVRPLHLSFLLAAMAFLKPPTPTPHGTEETAPGKLAYNKEGDLLLPSNYREWVFLSSGIDMVYGPKATVGRSSFDNVFADPTSYRSFVEHGTWPDKTMLLLEIRSAATNPSINHDGHSQSEQVTGIEVHVKDVTRFGGGWAFFDGDGRGTGKLLSQTADCYSCHRNHAAVDTTFVQFYPTLLPIARSKETLSPAYLKEFPPPPHR